MKRSFTILFLCLLILSVNACVRRHGRGSVAQSQRRETYERPRRGADSKQLSTDAETLSSSNSHSENKHIMTGKEIFRKYNTAVFIIYTSDGYSKSQGSGFFISPTGLAVSNYHVFENTVKGLEIIKTTNGNTYKIRDVVYYSKEDDLFIFSLDTDDTFNYVNMADEMPEVGDIAYAIGSPLGLENTLSSGEVSQIREDSWIQISVPIDHGSSGGALFNEYGNVIGITSAGIDESGANLNFARSIKLVKRSLQR